MAITAAQRVAALKRKSSANRASGQTAMQVATASEAERRRAKSAGTPIGSLQTFTEGKVRRSPFLTQELAQPSTRQSAGLQPRRKAQTSVSDIVSERFALEKRGAQSEIDKNVAKARGEAAKKAGFPEADAEALLRGIKREQFGTTSQFTGFSKDPTIRALQKKGIRARGLAGGSMGESAMEGFNADLKKFFEFGSDTGVISAQEEGRITLAGREEEAEANRGRFEREAAFGGGAIDLDDDTREALKIPEGFNLVKDGGEFKLQADPDSNLADIEIDPTKRTEAKLERTFQRGMKDINNAFDPAIRQLKGETDIHGNVSTQQSKRITKLLVEKQEKIKRFEEDVQARREDILIDEKSRQSDIEAILNKPRDPASELKRREAEETLERVNELLRTGAASTIGHAKNIIRKMDQTLTGKTDQQISSSIMESLANGQIDQNNIVAFATTAFDGDFVKGLKWANDLGINAESLAKQKRQYQTEVLHLDPDILEETDKIEGIRREMDNIFSGNTDNIGIGFTNIVESLKKQDPNGTLLKSFYDQTITSPTSNFVSKNMANIGLRELENDKALGVGMEKQFLAGLLTPQQENEFLKRKQRLKTGVLPVGSSGQQISTIEDWGYAILDGRNSISSVFPKELRSRVNSFVQKQVRSGYKPANPVLTELQQKKGLSLAKSYNGDKKFANMLDVENGNNTINTIYSDEKIESAVGFDDITAINAFQKMIDPGATVREGDVELLQKTVPFLSKISPTFKWKQFKKGDVLPSDVRKSLRRVARDVYDGKADDFNSTTAERFKGWADQAGIPFYLVGDEFVTNLEQESINQNLGRTSPSQQEANLTQQGIVNFEGLSPDEVAELSTINQ